MQQIFRYIGYTFSSVGKSHQSIRLYYINNPDGTPRWIWPEGLAQPLFLKFYNVATPKAQLFSIAVQLIFILGLQRVFFKSVICEMQCNALILPQFVPQQSNWAIFTGTTGPNNKLILYIKGAKRSSFFKIATSSNAENVIQREYEALSQLGVQPIITFTVPSISFKDKGVIGLEDIAEQTKRDASFSDLHINALQEIKTLTGSTLQVSDSAIGQQTKAILTDLLQTEDARVPKGMLKKLVILSDQLAQQTVQFTLSHGDFTPWNMYVKGEKLAIYDWELSHDALPIGYDAFHFMIQHGILVERASWTKIKAEMERRIPNSFFGDAAQRETYLQLYLLTHVVRSLKIYSEQAQWHTQVEWLMQTWNEALSEQVTSHIDARACLIMDTFDFLQTKAYAALKFPHTAPELTSEYADIDLCMDKKTADTLYLFLNQHTLTLHTRRTRKSFMDIVEVQLPNGQLLHFDLISQLKRKSLEMMDVSSVIQAAKMNTFGVKTAQEADDARFIALFYSLNKQSIPSKYSAYQSFIASDPLLAAVYNNEPVRPQLKALLESEPANCGFLGVKNKLNYWMDTIRGCFAKKGFIVTFSGVDGAGKSTVIEHVKHELEKRNRRKVVVIRHRPSLLPILSAWTKGKQQAEQEAAQKLPRQGDNKSPISSFARFAYYYSDYIIGQFYVYLRYVCNGYVVLYDRYYFDFINDSKRSNIQLPKAFVTAGYQWLLKPNFNFFLYASPETILLRKQELDKATIQGLTQDYIALFRKLDTTPHVGYFTLENIDLQTTIHTVMSKISPR
jgi:thymidylate kinase